MGDVEILITFCPLRSPLAVAAPTHPFSGAEVQEAVPRRRSRRAGPRGSTFSGPPSSLSRTRSSPLSPRETGDARQAAARPVSIAIAALGRGEQSAGGPRAWPWGIAKQSKVASLCRGSRESPGPRRRIRATLSAALERISASACFRRLVEKEQRRAVRPLTRLFVRGTKIAPVCPAERTLRALRQADSRARGSFGLRATASSRARRSPTLSSLRGSVESSCCESARGGCAHTA